MRDPKIPWSESGGVPKQSRWYVDRIWET